MAKPSKQGPPKHPNTTVQRIRLQHAGADIEKDACTTSGPYDVVLMDMTLGRLLHALLQARRLRCLLLCSICTQAGLAWGSVLLCQAKRVGAQ